jgi:hypothetical protein
MISHSLPLYVSPSFLEAKLNILFVYSLKWTQPFALAPFHFTYHLLQRHFCKVEEGENSFTYQKTCSMSG